LCEGILLVELAGFSLVEAFSHLGLGIGAEADRVNAVGAAEELSCLGLNLNIFPARLLPSARHELHILTYY
tara:strand:- start:169 stop:381 length:213 start_codon:yes stop_codon:yes gene_type:complete